MTGKTLKGTLLDERTYLSSTEICHACGCRSEWVIELVEEGILEPQGKANDEWLFPGNSLATAHAALRLQRDLGINLAGVALVLDLLEEMERLRNSIRRREGT